MPEEEFYNLSIEEALERLGSSPRGLSEAEARARLERYGPNELAQLARINPWRIFLRQFTELLVLILIFAALISFAIGYHQSLQPDHEEFPEEWIDAIVILAIVVMNAILGFLQEYRAERAIQALKALAAPKADVERDGERKEVPAREIVPGDIIILETGDKVPADARLLEVANLKVNEASLTGESTPVTKETEVIRDQVFVGERRNMVFMGSTVEFGRGKAAVASTGMATELGKIAGMVQTQEVSETPLQRRLARLAKQLTAIIGVAVVVIFAVGYTRGFDPAVNFLTAVSLAVAAIPEGLPAVVTVTLALGIQRMVRRNALIRRLPAAETLGSATVICSDKTGTITLGEMNITTVYANFQEFRVEGVGYTPQGRFLKEGEPWDPLQDPTTALLLRAGLLNNDATLKREEKGWRVHGDTTEGTLIVLARRAGLDKEAVEAREPRVAEIGFSSERKRMTTIHATDGRKVAYVKGAPEVLLERSNYILLHGEISLLKAEERERILEQNKVMASRALRVLALAFKPIPPERSDFREEWVEKDLIFLGLVGMIDAPREDAKVAIAQAKAAGIKVIMITGDHALTATAVAREIGLMESDGLATTGDDLDRVSDPELEKIVEKISVFARASPEHKIRIVGALKRRGHVVAVTGDGVNDAPALKMSDIGIAMGITGTDVAKEASDMILTDDNFASIVAAVEEGRGIYENIRKFVRYLLSTNSGEVLLIFTASLLFLPIPLLPIQILWVNLITDGFPALALGVEPKERGLMGRKPRNPRTSILAEGIGFHIAWVGTLMTIGTLVVFAWALESRSIEEARTIAFYTIALFQVFHVLAIRVSRQSVITAGFFGNRALIGAVALTVGLQFAVIYFSPLQAIFRTVALPVDELLMATLVASTIFLAVEVEKAVRRRYFEASEAGPGGEPLKGEGQG
jgi:Ca2+-transporting ATPase